MNKEIRVLLVEDSAVFRYHISNIIQRSGENIKIVDTAFNGKKALKKMKGLKEKIDVVVSDIVMPEMDGIETAGQIMDRFPTPIILISSIKEKREVEKALQTLGMSAFESGSIEFLKKPDPLYPNDKERFNKELILKIQNIALLDFNKIFSVFKLQKKVKQEQFIKKTVKRPSKSVWTEYRKKIIVIGASTGGPQAVSILFSMLPSKFPPVILVQHMPDGMIQPWIIRLQEAFPQLKIRLAKDGDILQPRNIYIAPTGKHCIIERGKSIKIRDGEKINFVIPAADVTFESAARVFGKNTLGIVLTGMGRDGLKGTRKIKAAGGMVIAEHKSTSIINSMPDAIIKANLADRISPIHQIANTIRGIGWI